MGYISQIMTILEEMCFGKFYFDSALLLRESIFINGILSSIEATYGLTSQDVENLEILDRILLRKILSAHSKCPNESLYLELGVMPIKFIIICRRLSFLHYILNRPDTDLLKQFFEIQCKYPTKNDWVLTIKQDINILSLKMTFKDIKNMKKQKFLKIIKEKARQKSLEYLLDLKKKHSKLDQLSYNKLKIQSYFGTSKISIKAAKSVFKYRTKMSSVKDNFHSMYNQDTLDCPECPGINDTQEHLIDHFDRSIDKPSYKMLFSNGYHKEKAILVKNMDLILNRRQKHKK